MELVKNIFFNTDKLIENTKVKISYTGTLFQDGSDEVYLHYGYGLQWDGVNDIKMEKSELGFQAEIDLIESDSLNFCFRNSNNIWDNNEGSNYIFPIEKIEVETIDTTNDVGSYLIESSPRRLRKSYIWSKKIRLALYKIMVTVPKIISGNYKRKIRNEQ